MYSTDVSMRLFHSMSILWLSLLSWNSTTDGVFQFVLNDTASPVDVCRTRKSLNRCHCGCSGGIGSE